VLVRWKQFGSMSGPNALVICGPSGVGKGTLIDMLKQEFPNAFGFSVSHTTREPRPGEKNGVHYHFVTVMQMEADIKAGKFIEYAKVHDNFYGTSRAAVESVKKTGKICILDIDVQGCRLCRQANVPGIYVFVSPPSFEVLEQRLRGRGTETEDKIVKRLANAKGEMDARNEAGLFDKQVRLLLYRALSPRVERVPGRCTADMAQTPAAHKHAFLGLFAAASLDGL
jgi:guanylate kinase